MHKARLWGKGVLCQKLDSCGKAKITSSMKINLEDLKLDQIKVIFPGNISFKLSEKIEAIGLGTLVN